MKSSKKTNRIMIFVIIVYFLCYYFSSNHIITKVERVEVIGNSAHFRFSSQNASVIPLKLSYGGPAEYDCKILNEWGREITSCFYDATWTTSIKYKTWLPLQKKSDEFAVDYLKPGTYTISYWNDSFHYLKEKPSAQKFVID